MSKSRATAGLAWCAALALLAGCRNLDNAQVDVLERELRQQEDYIYELEDYLVSYSEKLRQCRMAANCQPVTTGASTKKKNVVSGEPELMDDRPRAGATRSGRKLLAPPSTTETLPSPSTGAAADASPPATEAEVEPLPSPEEPAPVDLDEMEVPDVELGPGANMLNWKTKDPVATAPTLPPEQVEPVEEAPLYLPDPVDYQADLDSPGDEPAAEPTAPSAEPGEPLLAAPELGAPRLSAEKLKIRCVFGEPAADGAAPLEKLLVVVEALNATDEPVDAIGAASVMVTARDEAGAPKRVDRWDFTAEETAAAWQSSHLGDGLHLELPLEGRELPAGELELWARVTDDGGQKLLTSVPLVATQLTSVEEATPAAPQLAAETPRAVPAAESAPAPAAIERRVADSPKWRASAQRLDPNRVEGYASTASGTRGWISQPAKAQAPRVADAGAKVATPPWQQNTAAQSPRKSRREWTPFR